MYYYQIRLKSGANWGAWVSLAALGASGVTRTLTTCAPDIFEFSVSVQDALSAAPAFPYNAEASVRRQLTDSLTDATHQWFFRGRVRSVPVQAGPSDESYRVTVEGPWSWFNTTVFRQAWPEYSGATLGSVSKPRAILFMAADGARLATGPQLQAVCAAAVAAGAPCTVQAMTGGITPPYDEQTNITCAQAALRALSYHPHGVLWFDYSTETPVLKFAQRAALDAVSVPFAGEPSFSIRARDDLKVPAVAIYYERQNTVDGESRPATTLDKYPALSDESADSVLTAVYDLRGDAVQTVSQAITAEAFPSGWETSKAWWKARVPWLRDYADADIALSSGGRLGDSSLANILVSGALQPWMNVTVEKERAAVTVSLVGRAAIGGSPVEVERVTKRVTVELEVTGAPVGTTVYRAVASWDAGEDVPEGVAQSLYQEWSQSHYEGSITLAEEEPSGAVAVGKRLNITGGLSAWASMGALVTRVTEQIDAGTTSVSFGPPGWTEVDARVLFERVARSREPAVSLRLRTGADTSAGISGPVASAQIREGNSDLDRSRLLVCNPLASPLHAIDLNPAAVAKSADAGVASVIQPREVLLPFVDTADGNKLKARPVQVMASAAYGTAVALAADLATATPAAVALEGVVGTSAKAAREDHVHAGAALSDATPSAVAATGAAGVATAAARADHAHAGVQLTSATPAALTGSAAVGTSGDAARADHAHAVSISLPGPGPDTGAPVQDGGTALMPAPAGFLGSSADFSRRDHSHPVNADDAVLPADTADTASYGTSNRYSRADHVHKGGGAALDTATPVADTGTGTVGTSVKAAHGDHAHPLNVNTATPAAPTTAGAVGTADEYARSDHQHPARATGLGSVIDMANAGIVAAKTTFGWAVGNAAKNPVKLWRHRHYYRSTAGSEALVGIQHYEIYDAVTGALVEVGPESEYTIHIPEAGY